eukprot:UN27660
MGDVDNDGCLIEALFKLLPTMYYREYFGIFKEVFNDEKIIEDQIDDVDNMMCCFVFKNNRHRRMILKKIKELRQTVYLRNYRWGIKKHDRRYGIGMDKRHERFSIGDLIVYNNRKGRIVYLFDDSAIIALTSFGDIFTVKVKYEDINMYVEIGDFIQCEFVDGHWYEGQIIKKNSEQKDLGLVVEPLAPFYKHIRTDSYIIGWDNVFVDVKNIRPIRSYISIRWSASDVTFPSINDHRKRCSARGTEFSFRTSPSIFPKVYYSKF